MKKSFTQTCINKALPVLFLLCCMIISFIAHAQTGTIAGKVTDSSGHPLASATVKIKGGKRLPKQTTKETLALKMFQQPMYH